MCDESQSCGDCEDCQRTDTYVNLRPRFQAPPPPLGRDGGESEMNR